MIVGVLLAAGQARRFGGDKLLVELDDGLCVAEASCANLRPAVDRLIAVVRPGAGELAQRLALAGAEIFECAQAAEGMGASLAHGVALMPDADGWLIALADMPLIAPEAALRIADALRAGAAIAVPVARGQRGHPVGFGRAYFAALTALDGDRGARTLLAQNADRVIEIPIADASAWLDIDTVDDVAIARKFFKRGHP